MDRRWRDIEIIIASDVENPTLGEKGAARIFGPQKGADAAMVEILERNLRHCFNTIHEQMGNRSAGYARGWRRWGLRGWTYRVLPCKIVSGIDLVLNHNRFVDHLADSALVITGEGQMDTQTIDGKGPIGVAQLAREHGVPTVALVGGLNIDDKVLREAGIAAAFSIVDKPMPLQQALDNAEDLLTKAALRLGFVLQLFERD